jgi:molybdopterin-guanine dinucleotide biosynthesis protein A
MGRNKALIEIDGRPMIERAADLAGIFTDRVYISSNQPRLYEFLDLPVVPDVFVKQGPLAGMHAVMARSERPLTLMLASDLPRIHPSLIRCLIDSVPGADIVVPCTSDGRRHPLCGVYRVSCLQAVERNLRAGNNKVLDLLREPELAVKILTGREWPFPDSDLMNLNEPGIVET